jgi:hypothetical protein
MKKQLLVALTTATLFSGGVATADDSKPFYRGGADNDIVTAVSASYRFMFELVNSKVISIYFTHKQRK